MFLSLYCKGSKRLCGVLLWEGAGDWTQLQYFDPIVMTVNVVSFLFSWCWGPLCWVLAFFTVSYQHLLWTPIHQGFPRTPSTGCGFPYHIATQLACRTQLSYIIVRRQLDLWNRMFNRHQPEITVMQFRGHSLPVHHSVVAQWDLHLVPYYQP